MIRQNALGNLFVDEEGYLLEVNTRDNSNLMKKIGLAFLMLPMLLIVISAYSEFDLTDVDVGIIRFLLYGFMGIGLFILIMAVLIEKIAKVEFSFYDQYMEYYTKGLIRSKSILIEYNDIKGFSIRKIGDFNMKIPIIHTKHGNYSIETIVGEEKCKLLINTIKKASKKMLRKEMATK